MTRRRRIALISSHGGLNGAAKVVESLVRGLVKEDCEVRLYHRPDAWFTKQNLGEVADLRPVEMGIRKLNNASVRRVRSELEDWAPLALHSHGTTGDRFSSAVRLKGRIATVSTAHARVFHPHWRRHDLVIAPSTYTAEWYLRWHLVRRDRLQTISNGIPDPLRKTCALVRDKVRSELGLDPAAFVLTMVGDVSGRKNQSAAIPLLASLRERGIDARLIVVGNLDRKEAPKLRVEAAKAGVAEAIVLTGQRGDVLDILNASDCFLSTSRDEQGSIAVAEAMALKLPVFVTSVGSGCDIIADLGRESLIDLKRPAGNASHIEHLAKDRCERTRRGAAARACFEARFRMNSYIEKTLAAYDSLAPLTGYDLS